MITTTPYFAPPLPALEPNPVPRSPKRALATKRTIAAALAPLLGRLEISECVLGCVQHVEETCIISTPHF